MDDEKSAPQVPVVRLGEREHVVKVDAEKPVRLRVPRSGPVQDQPAPETSRRLAVPSKEEVELRTYQPGIEAIIETETFTPEQLEQAWGESSARRQPIPWGWFALISLAIVAAVVWSVSRVHKADEVATRLAETTASALEVEEREEIEARRLIERIERNLRACFAATSVESLAKLVRHPDRVVPLMRDYYANRPVAGSILKSVRLLQPVTIDDHGNFWMAYVALANGQTRSVIMEVIDGGEPKIDWETMVCHQPMPWDDFVRSRPAGTSMDFRVYIEKDNLHSHEFGDADRWTNFRLTALDSEETLFGYAQVGSAAEQGLMELLQGSRRASVILRLIVPEGLQAPRAAVIEELVNRRWLITEPPPAEP